MHCTKSTSRQARTPASRTKRSTPRPHTLARRNKISIGHAQRVSRAESMAENAQLRRQLAHEQNIEYCRTQREKPPQAPISAAFGFEEKKQKLISSLDLPRKSVKQQDLNLSVVADSAIPFSPAEVGQILSLVAQNHGSNYQAGSKIMQDLISRDYLPYKSALRGLGRLFEHAGHFSGATAVFKQYKNLYPDTEHDEIGFPKAKEVLTQPIPDFNAIAATQPDKHDITSVETFVATLDDLSKVHKTFARYATHHHLMRLYLAQNQPEKAVQSLFQLWKRVGIAETDVVPKPFDAIAFHAQLIKGPESGEFSPVFPLYYQVVNVLIKQQNWSAAMQSLIYMRSFLRLLDVTPLRECTTSKVWRDYLDIHTLDAQAIEFTMAHQLAELTVRRGYKKAMEKAVPGSVDAKTYNNYSYENQLTYSPLIATEPEHLVILTDRSYRNKPILEERDVKTYEETNGGKTVNFLKQKYGINAKLSFGGELSGNAKFVQYHAENPNATDTPLNHEPRDLTVIIPKEELIAFAERNLDSLQVRI